MVGYACQNNDIVFTYHRIQDGTEKVHKEQKGHCLVMAAQVTQDYTKKIKSIL